MTLTVECDGLGLVEFRSRCASPISRVPEIPGACHGRDYAGAIDLTDRAASRSHTYRLPSRSNARHEGALNAAWVAGPPSPGSPASCDSGPPPAIVVTNPGIIDHADPAVKWSLTSSLPAAFPCQSDRTTEAPRWRVRRHRRTRSRASGPRARELGDTAPWINAEDTRPATIAHVQRRQARTCRLGTIPRAAQRARRAMGWRRSRPQARSPMSSRLSCTPQSAISGRPTPRLAS